MRRLLIIGCGDVVRRALPRLLRHWRIYALVRRKDPALAALGVTQILGDLDHADTLRRLRGLAHTVIHSAPPPAASPHARDPRTRRLIAALQAGRSVLHGLVYISTTGVYGDCGGAHIDETQKLAPLSDRARRRVDAEHQLRRFGISSHCRISILRAPGIYAADRLPLERLRQHLPLFEARDDIYTNHIHADDLATICSAALHYGKPNRAYNACDDSDILMGDWYDKLANSFALPHAPRLPRAEAETQLSPMQLSFVRESRRIDNVRLKRELKVRLRYPTVDDGLRAARGDMKKIVEEVHAVG